MVEDARRAGSRLLYVVSTTPKWATTHPDNPLHPTAEQRKAGINEPDFYPPENWQDMADFLQAFWQRYAPGGKLDVVDSVEVWNEPNVFFAGTYADYAKMCQVVYETTKKFAPDAKVIGVSQSGGLHGPWVKGVLDAGAGKWMDLASTHNYEIGTPPSGRFRSNRKSSLSAMRSTATDVPMSASAIPRRAFPVGADGGKKFPMRC